MISKVWEVLFSLFLFKNLIETFLVMLFTWIFLFENGFKKKNRRLVLFQVFEIYNELTALFAQSDIDQFHNTGGQLTSSTLRYAIQLLQYIKSMAHYVLSFDFFLFWTNTCRFIFMFAMKKIREVQVAAVWCSDATTIKESLKMEAIWGRNSLAFESNNLHSPDFRP